jgi:large subunit ribosomal protein L4
MEIAVYNIAGVDTGKKVTLNDEVFAVEPNEHVVYLDVKQHLANKRQGTHKTKERGEVARSTKKIKRQKGTGGARAGSMKNPTFKGGGRIFGPRPRTYGFKLNQKVKQLARRSVLSDKAKNENIIVLENFDFQIPKTKDFVKLQTNLKLIDKNSLFVLQNQNKSIYLSARNLTDTKVSTVSEINTYDILRAKKLVLTVEAVEHINKTFVGN